MLNKIALKGGLNEREAVFTVEPKFSEDSAGLSSKAELFFFLYFPNISGHFKIRRKPEVRFYF